MQDLDRTPHAHRALAPNPSPPLIPHPLLRHPQSDLHDFHHPDFWQLCPHNDEHPVEHDLPVPGVHPPCLCGVYVRNDANPLFGSSVGHHLFDRDDMVRCVRLWSNSANFSQRRQSPVSGHLPATTSSTEMTWCTASTSGAALPTSSINPDP
ncbi:9-cis-epoxycarotenoid dioxygenase 1, chloroplastic [Asimina triloba]